MNFNTYMLSIKREDKRKWTQTYMHKHTKFLQINIKEQKY